MLPNLLPAILSGTALAFARAVGEFGSVVLISGNIPFKTEVASVYIFGQIESDDVTGAAAVSVVLLVDLVRGCCSRSARSAAGGRGTMASRLALRSVALGYLARCCSCPLAIVGYRTFEHGIGRLGRRHDARGAPRLLADAPDRRHRRAR